MEETWEKSIRVGKSEPPKTCGVQGEEVSMGLSEADAPGEWIVKLSIGLKKQPRDSLEELLSSAKNVEFFPKTRWERPSDKIIQILSENEKKSKQKQ